MNERTHTWENGKCKVCGTSQRRSQPESEKIVLEPKAKFGTPPANRAETPQDKPKTETWWVILATGKGPWSSLSAWYPDQSKAWRVLPNYGEGYEVVKVTVEPVPHPPANDIRSKLLALRTEVNCRIEHGADSNGHLQYVQDRLDEILTPPAA